MCVLEPKTTTIYSDSDRRPGTIEERKIKIYFIFIVNWHDNVFQW